MAWCLQPMPFTADKCPRSSEEEHWPSKPGCRRFESFRGCHAMSLSSSGSGRLALYQETRVRLPVGTQGSTREEIPRDAEFSKSSRGVWKGLSAIPSLGKPSLCPRSSEEERRPSKPGAGGSNPSGGAKCKRSSVGRVPASQAGCRGFEPHRLLHVLIVQRIELSPPKAAVQVRFLLRTLSLVRDE
jgi:hypothetical protein